MASDIETPRVYSYVTVLSVYDGDTITVEIDHGFRLRHVETVRLARINAPELKGEQRPEGLRSAVRLRQLLPVGTRIVLQTYKSGVEKYGRFLADVMLGDVTINDVMVSEGFAVYKDY